MRFAGLIQRLALLACVASAAAQGDAASAPPPNPALALARAALPPATPSRETEHFVLLTDADLASADTVLETLEAAHRAFRKACASIGVTPAPLPHKLVAVLFRDQVDYQRFNQRHKPGMPDWTAGYYDPVTDRLVMYDQISQANVQKALAAVERNRLQLEREVADRGITPAQTGRPGNGVDQARMQLDRNVERIVTDVRNAFLSTVAHEATHGLFFDTGVQLRSVDYPFWISEGLATNLEPTFAKDRDFGFHRDNPRRRDAFQDAVRGGQLARLSELVLCDAAPIEDARGEVGRLYAQACMFTKWLARERPTELRLYLDELRQGAWSDRDSRLARFEAIFGPVESLERSWLRAEAREWTGLMASPIGTRLQAFDRRPVRAEASSDTSPAQAAESSTAVSPSGR